MAIYVGVSINGILAMVVAALLFAAALFVLRRVLSARARRKMSAGMPGGGVATVPAGVSSRSPTTITGVGTALTVLLVIAAVDGVFLWLIFMEQAKTGAVMFGVMALGCTAKWVWNALQEAKASQTAPQLDLYELAPALLVAPIVYGVVLAAAQSTQPALPLLSAAPASLLLAAIAAFQNGFFWQTVFDQLR